MRLWPRSLVGQVILASGLALLLAHLLAAFLLIRAGQEQREERQVNAAAFAIVQELRGSDDRMSRRGGAAMRRLPPRIRTTTSATSPLIAGEKRSATAEARLRDVLAVEGILIDEIVFVRRAAMADPLIREFADTVPPRARDRLSRAQISVAGVRLAESNRWIVSRTFRPRGPRGLPQAMVVQLGLVFLILAVGQYFLLRRITRPLAALTERVETFADAQSAEDQLTPSGPQDVSRLIAAHNAMENRIVGLLDEKDVMLGAIGHDLKTPLAALRVRIESVEDETQRAKMAAQIDEIARTLDDILSLARVGRHESLRESLEIGALLQMIANEYCDLGKTVTVDSDARIKLDAQTTWLARGIRNLVDNALRYAGSAQLSAVSSDDQVAIRVDDNGPGIEPDKVAAMLEPFARGETSRNRATGGAGLGLTLARAIAEQHGGELVLSNRPEGGLRSELRLPRRA